MIRTLALVFLILRTAAAQINRQPFDMLLLVRQWGPTFCESTACNSSPVGEFTIHGLWPQYSSGGYPQSCDPFDKFSTSNLEQQLLNQMACEWVSYTGTNSGFWSYEWSKHGTCALSLFPTQQEYFDAAITLNNEFEVTQALESSGINPSTASSVPVSQLTSAFQNAWGVTPVVTCQSGALSEVWLCLDLDLNAVACPSNLRYSKCSTSASFPEGNAVPAACSTYYPQSNSSSSSPSSPSSSPSPSGGGGGTSTKPPSTTPTSGNTAALMSPVLVAVAALVLSALHL